MSELDDTLRYPISSWASERIVRECGYLFARTTVQGDNAFPPSNRYVWGTSVVAVEKLRLLKKLLSKRTTLAPDRRIFATNLAWDCRRLALRSFEKARLSNGVLHVRGNASEVVRPRLTRELLDVFGHVEEPVPFLDRPFFDHVAALPLDRKLRDGWTKRIFRRAMSGILPEEIRLRRSKIGFETPEKTWIQELREHLQEFISGFAGEVLQP
jgi:hypothetical protein